MASYIYWSFDIMANCSSVSSRVVMPCYKGQDESSPWPSEFSSFGIETPGRLQFRGQPIGKYSADPKDFIGIVAPDIYQHNPPLEYETSGYTVRWIVITVDGFEHQTDSNGTQYRLYVSPHTPGRVFTVEA